MAEEPSLKQKTVKGVFWSSLGSFSVKGVQFVVMIVMANLLTPEDYGLVGMLTIFIAVSDTFISSGFGSALIRKQDRTNTDCSTVFYFNIAVASFFYALLFFAAPFIADFYNEPLLAELTRVIGLVLIINGFNQVQGALMTARMDFKTSAKISFTSAVVSGGVGLTLAFNDFGCWALVGQQIAAALCRTLLYWYFSKWRPVLVYSWKSFRELFGFSSKLLASGLLDTIYGNIYPLIIGKLYSAATLGFYNRAQHFAELPSVNITGIIQGVSYPALCTLQHDDARLATTYRKFIRISAFVIFPLMMGLAGCAKPLIITLVGEKWLFSVLLLQIICFRMVWYPLHAINLNLLIVKGRSDLFLKLEIIKKVIGVFFLVISAPFGIVAMCVGSIFSSFFCLIVNTYYTGKIINVGFFKQMGDISKTIVLSLLMGTLVLCISMFCPTPHIFTLTIAIAAGALFYIATAKMMRFPELKEIIEIRKTQKQKDQ